MATVPRWSRAGIGLAEGLLSRLDTLRAPREG